MLNLLRRATTSEHPDRGAPTEPDQEALTVLLVRREVIDTIRDAVACAGWHETGGPLLGIVQRTWDGERFRPMAAALGTLPPGPAIDGRMCSVALGARSDGERAASALRWLRDVTGLDLVHLGDWHCHPGGIPEPSSGDRRTAREMRAQAATPIWVVAIAVGQTASHEETNVSGNAIESATASDSCQQVRFFQECSPVGLVPLRTRIESDVLPALPPLPWHITDPTRFAAEIRLLAAAGFSLAIEPAQAGDRPGMTLRLGRSTGVPLTVHTGLRYPFEAPVITNGTGRPMQPRTPWSTARFIVDAVKEVS